ncbi:hypothetical protein PENSPDRAFT_657257 [Peniophora sp. CONT]|nr:hypothetical protein PENSPDRAFT_657257 [Peniophora sp. CONT]
MEITETANTQAVTNAEQGEVLKKPVTKRPPPIPQSMANKAAVYGWRVEDFVQKHYDPEARSQLEEYDIESYVDQMRDEILADTLHYVLFGRGFIWLSRNFIEPRHVYKSGISPIPDEDGVRKIADKFGLGPPEWHVLYPGEACCDCQETANACAVTVPTKPIKNSPPPIPESMKKRHALYGWRLDIREFAKNHCGFESDESADEDEVTNRIMVAAEDIGLYSIHVHVSNKFIWLSRNYISERSGQIHDTGINPIPNDDSVEKFADKFGLGPPEWLLLNPRLPRCECDCHA